MQNTKTQNIRNWQQRVGDFLGEVSSIEFFPHTKRLFRIALLAWFGLHTLLLIPYHRMLWSNEAYILRAPFQPHLWKSYLYGLLDIPWLSENYGLFIAAQLFFITAAILEIYPRFFTLFVFITTLSINHRSGVTMDGGDNLAEILLVF